MYVDDILIAFDFAFLKSFLHRFNSDSKRRENHIAHF